MSRPGHPRNPRRGGLIINLLLAMAVLGAVAAVAWMVLLPSMVVSVVQAKTGFRLKVDELAANPFTGRVHVMGLVVKNPEGWPEPAFVDLRRFDADASLYSLFTDRWVADRLVLDVAQVTLVRNQAGTLNAALFKDGLAAANAEGRSAPAPAASPRGFLIRHLILKFDRLVSADYSGRKPVVKTYEVALSRDLTDVDSLTKVISPFTGASLSLISGTLGHLFKGRDDLLSRAPAPIQDAVGNLQDAGRRTGETLKGLIQSLEKKKP